MAMYLATVLRAEVVNCDSVQVYRYFDIGTAKASDEERRAVRHHLIDILDPVELFTAGDYARIARQTVAEIAARDAVPVIAGGTGFYLRALLDGLFEGPQRDEALRVRLMERERKRPGSLHRILERLDRQASKRIHRNDINKTVRALEICMVARQPATELFAQGTRALEGFAPLLVGLDPPREELYERLNRRAAAMFAGGLVEEVAGILGRGWPRTAKPFESLGYKQALQVLEGTSTVAEAVDETQKQTRHYAKRQWTWFKKDGRVSWIPGFGHLAQTQENTLLTLLSKHCGLANFLR